MDFVDEQHVALFEIGEKCGEIAGLGDDGPGSGAKADAEFTRDDLRQRGLAEAGGTDEQHMVQRLFPLARGLDEDREIGARLRLADEFGQELRAQRSVAGIISAAFRRDDAGGRGHVRRIARPVGSMSGTRTPLPFAGRGWGGGSTWGLPPWPPPSPSKGGGRSRALATKNIVVRALTSP